MASVSFSRLATLRSLVIDDQAGMRQNMRLHLGQLGMTRVDQAATPDEAIHFVESNRYDVVVCDYNLNNETNGQHLLEFFRSHNLLPESTIFIMVTAESSYGSVAGAAEFKPDAYMIKPLTATKLAERIERMLDKQNSFLPITQYIARKDTAGAIVACDELLAAEPKWIVEILKLKGRMLLELRRVDEARALYHSALSLRSDLVWASLGLAKCEVIAGQPAKARSMVETLLAKHTQYIEAYDLLAQVAESTGNSDVALDALSRSARIIPSAPRSRLVGDAAYRVGDLAQAEEAFSQAVKLSKGSMTGQASDLISLAQVYVDSGNADAALQVFTGVPRRYVEAPQFIAAQAAMQAQAYAKLGDLAQAKQAFSVAMEHAGETGETGQTGRSDSATLGLARAAFAVGQDDYAAELIADAIKSDHENRFLVAQARRVLSDAGKEELIAELIDRPMNECLAVIAEANALMRGAQFEASLSKLEEALDNMPQNTGVLMAAAQIYLLWMSQKGVNQEYVTRVNGYLAKLEQLIPGNERVAKMHLFLQRILEKS
ncbi:MAG TPA: tetratricopeptide repeat protein [Herbaspirillum sp.]|nr:tetratricopeptide repeat protein [Herbaspirillum sp.]